MSFFFLLNCQNIFGQYRFENWTTDNGLPQNGIRRIVQTPDGYIWFTTFDGLVRFDGVRFTTFGKGNTKGIYNNRFAYLYCDKNGTLYAATSNEIGSLTIYQNGHFTSYPPSQIPGSYISFIGEDENGEVRFLMVEDDEKSFNWYKLQNDVFILNEKFDKETLEFKYRSDSETLWVITQKQIIEHKGTKKFVYSYPAVNFELLREGFEDSKKGLWIGGKELVRLQDGNIQSFKHEITFPPNTEYHSFWEDEDGSIWFATGGKSGFGSGLIRYKEGKFSTFGSNEGLSDPSIFHAFKDREGIIWLATNRGLNRLRKKIITSYSIKDGLLNHEVNPLFRDSKNNIWIGTTGGVNIYSNGKFTPFTFKSNPTKREKLTNSLRYTQSFMEDSSGAMWIGTTEGIFVNDNQKLELLDDTDSYYVFSLYQNESNQVLAATNKGILLIDNYKVKNIYTTADGLKNNYTTSIFKDSKGSLWFGTFGGLAEFKNNRFTTYTKDDGLAGDIVRAIYEDKIGTLWIGTYDEGLSRYKDGKFTSYKVSDGLFNNGVFSIQEDEQGYFWISSNVGIYRVKINELNDFAEGKINRIESVGYGKEDGMLNSECNGGRHPASVKDQNGNIWFPTQDGVSVVTPSLETNNLLPPKVVIESVSIEKKNINVDKNIIVKQGERNIEITYTGISLHKSDQIRFKYRLEGHDFNWVEAENRRSAFYSYLPPGEYQFQVIAANSYGIWNDEGAKITLEVKPYFYQTYWFRIVSALIILAILFGSWRISIFRLKEKEKELALLVNEKTEEIRQANEELLKLANSDGLTKVGNRRFFEEFLENEWNRSRRTAAKASLILLDVDYFKIYNDTYGHQAGDNCLRDIAIALKKSIRRTTDAVARYGGEEFAIILGNTDSKGAVIVANLIKKNIYELNIKHEKSPISDRITASIGVTTINEIAFNQLQTELIEDADKALYQAKENGRNQIIIREI